MVTVGCLIGKNRIFWCKASLPAFRPRRFTIKSIHRKTLPLGNQQTAGTAHDFGFMCVPDPSCLLIPADDVVFNAGYVNRTNGEKGLIVRATVAFQDIGLPFMPENWLGRGNS